ncbi:SPOR domain-containing protein [Thalassotalea agarivorans]|uniref:Cell division protein FtsN n=1 Tax=Thalassotalea agarivorans TaxID=349064 RepID=A0A1I0H672_THASX|nr:SPOR domain-containing protein [Thalassotalea agarivorans]SET79226.1 cell division protein FtsN [Thalassotalea agarivorans]
MAHQDYVSRSRKPNKKNNPYQRKQTKKKASPAMPLKAKIATVAMLVIIPAFVYGLMQLAKIEPTKTVSKPEEKPVETVATVETKNGVELPEPPKEEWSYVDDLKNKEVEAGEYEVPEKGPYKMQCGSFKRQSDAERLRAQIAFVGLEAMVSESNGSNGKWFKVYLGPYERKRLAEKDKHKLKSNNVNHCQIWLWR